MHRKILLRLSERYLDLRKSLGQNVVDIGSRRDLNISDPSVEDVKQDHAPMRPQAKMFIGITSSWLWTGLKTPASINSAAATIKYSDVLYLSS